MYVNKLKTTYSIQDTTHAATTQLNTKLQIIRKRKGTAVFNRIGRHKNTLMDIIALYIHKIVHQPATRVST